MVISHLCVGWVPPSSHLVQQQQQSQQTAANNHSLPEDGSDADSPEGSGAATADEEEPQVDAAEQQAEDETAGMGALYGNTMK